MSSGDDWEAAGVGGLSEAAAGAAAGAPFGGVGALVGGGIGLIHGGLTGFFGSRSAHRAADTQKAALDAAMKRLQAFSQQQSAARTADLEKTMAFYDAPDAYLHSIYAQPTPPPPGATAMPGALPGFAGGPPAGGKGSMPMGGLPQLQPLPPLPPAQGDPRRGAGRF